MAKLLNHLKGLTIAFFPAAIITVVVLGWLFGATGSFDENPFRIVLSGIFVLTLPGLLCGQVIGVRSDSLIEAIAFSFFGSLVVLLVLTTLTLIAGIGIREWSSLLVVWNLAWLGGVFYFQKVGQGGLLDTLSTNPSPKGAVSERLFVAILLLLAIALYRWGERLTAVDWEIGVHFSYVRLYVSELGLGYQEMGLRSELPVATIFFLWEYILSGISSLAGQDPLIAGIRTRWVMPILGFSCYFVFLRHVLNNKILANQVLWGCLILVLSQIMFLTPNPFVTSMVTMEDTRPLFSFLGSIHHGEVAMELLLPMTTGFVFMYMQDGRKQVLGVISLSLLVAFFMHPREYFQLMWYGLLWSIVVFMTVRRFDRGVFFRRAVFLGVVFIAMAGVSAVISIQDSTGEGLSDGNIEFAKKIAQIEDLLNNGWLPPYFENPVNFQMHGFLGHSDVDPSLVFSFLVLATMMVPVLAAFGSRHDRRITLFFVFLWIMSTTFVPSERLLTILTYSEMLITKVRVLPIFGTIVIVLGWLRLMERLTLVTGVSGWRAHLQCGGVGIGLGVVFMAFWKWQAPDFGLTRTLFPLILGVGVLMLATSIWEQRVKQAFPPLRAIPFPPRLNLTVNGQAQNGIAALFSLALFAGVVGHMEISQLGKILLFTTTDVEALAGEKNDLNLPVDTLNFIREKLPPRVRIQVRPESTHMLAAFVSVQVIPIPQGNINKDLMEHRQELDDSHPVFNSDTKQGRGDIVAMMRHFRQRKVEYILIGREYFEGFKMIAEMHPRLFTILHEVPGETLVMRLNMKGSSQ